MNDYQNMYLTINNEFSNVIRNSLEQDTNSQKHAKIAHFYEDYENWIKLCDGENESLIYREANSEYRTMLLFMCMGLYKNAYMSLRGYFELTMFGIQISTCDLDYRLWKNGKKDVHWSEITNKDNGLFSKKYIEAYNEPLIDAKDTMLEEAICEYRTCSEYIHSGYHVASSDMKISFEQDVFDNICEDVKRINRIVTYSFCIRYGELIKKQQLQSTFVEGILEQLPDVQAIHEYLK